MHKRTFEIISKYIAKENQVTLMFDTDGEAYADMNNNILHFPKDISSENALAALALIMHESAHLRYSKDLPIKELCPKQSDFRILNAIEDIRIDCKNFRTLPNIKGCYEKMVEKFQDLTTRPPENRAHTLLSAGILTCEGFPVTMKKDDENYMNINRLPNLMNSATRAIDQGDWERVKRHISKIKKILKVDPKKDKPNTEIQIEISGKPGSGEGKDKEGQGFDAQFLKGMKAGDKPGSGWGDGKPMKGGSSELVGDLAMDEMAVNEFKEIMNIKEVQTFDDGLLLDTDNLTAYNTGSIEELFREEKIIRKKKSKIFFLLDSSGSMAQPLIDGNFRYRVVRSCVQKLIKIIEEVQAQEGLNVDWDIGEFNGGFNKLDKERWAYHFQPGGGTNLKHGFDGAMEEMINDYTIEGKRIIVCFTDGEVSAQDVDHVSLKIQEHHADIRTMIIGVGSELGGRFAQEFIGDRVIVAQDNAQEIIIETIKEML